VPELPEVETLVRGLRPLLPGARIERIRVLHDDVLRTSVRRFADGVRHRTITAVDRRAKNIVMPLDGGEAYLVVNLGMTGALFPQRFIREDDSVPERFARKPTHPAVRFGLDGGRALVYHDIRRFGVVEVLRPDAWCEREARMGPEPLAEEYGAADLHAGLSASRTPVRNWLLDQRRIAGVGNIYASEACFRAGVHPRRPANEVDAEEAASMHDGLRSVLSAAIEHGGTTLQNYRDADGRPGLFGTLLRVYGREEEPCVTCGTPIERIVIGNRSAFLCPLCQPG